jgi:hypothetical protein
VPTDMFAHRPLNVDASVPVIAGVLVLRGLFG